MKLQYIKDDKGETTGVFIPIKEWNNLKSKYSLIEQDEFEIPESHRNIVRERIKNSKPDDYLSWDKLEKKLNLD
jgi:hypothetical protein